MSTKTHLVVKTKPTSEGGDVDPIKMRQARFAGLASSTTSSEPAGKTILPVDDEKLKARAERFKDVPGAPKATIAPEDLQKKAARAERFKDVLGAPKIVNQPEDLQKKAARAERFKDVIGAASSPVAISATIPVDLEKKKARAERFKDLKQAS